MAEQSSHPPRQQKMETLETFHCRWSLGGGLGLLHFVMYPWVFLFNVKMSLIRGDILINEHSLGLGKLYKLFSEFSEAMFDIAYHANLHAFDLTSFVKRPGALLCT